MRLHDEGELFLVERMLQLLRFAARRFAICRSVNFCRHDPFVAPIRPVAES